MNKSRLSQLGLKAKIAIGVTLVFLFFRFCVPYVSPHVAHPSSGSWEASWPAIRPKSFADRWLDSELLHGFDGKAIRDYCAATDWRDNIIFNLQGATGGVGNVRASVLDFIFFALEVGTGIILPGMVERSDSDLYDVWHGTHANFSRMFDEDFFLGSMQQLCPQMRIIQPGDKVLKDMRNIDSQYPWRARREDKDIGNTRFALRVSVDDWLRNHDFDNKTTGTIINVDRTLWQADTRSLPAGLRISWPKLIRINPSIRRFAGLAMAKLAAGYGVKIRPTDSMHENAFMGAHLRTESDTLSAGWFDPTRVTETGVDFEGQTDAYLALAEKHHLNLMYVATGNHSEFERFVDKAAEVAPHMRLVSKFDLLSEFEGSALREFEWDQQGLVDLEILRRCSIFGGFTKSSFSSAIVIARHQWLEDHGRPLGKGWYERELGDQRVAFDDGISRMVGRNEIIERECPRGAWPF